MKLQGWIDSEGNIWLSTDKNKANQINSEVDNCFQMLVRRYLALLLFFFFAVPISDFYTRSSRFVICKWRQCCLSVLNTDINLTPTWFTVGTPLPGAVGLAM